MLTSEIIKAVELTVNRLHKKVHTTHAIRHQSASELQAWKDATDKWHSLIQPTGYLWEDDFLTDLRNSKRSAIEDAITYLEVDPWYHRSGYLKERLIRGLKSATLRERDRKRLWNVILNVASGRNRREFRNYCSLAAAIGDPQMFSFLKDNYPASDLNSRGKFTYLLIYLFQNSTFAK